MHDIRLVLSGLFTKKEKTEAKMEAKNRVLLFKKNQGGLDWFWYNKDDKGDLKLIAKNQNIITDVNDLVIGLKENGII